MLALGTPSVFHLHPKEGRVLILCLLLVLKMVLFEVYCKIFILFYNYYLSCSETLRECTVVVSVGSSPSHGPGLQFGLREACSLSSRRQFPKTKEPKPVPSVSPELTHPPFFCFFLHWCLQINSSGQVCTLFGVYPPAQRTADPQALWECGET